MDSDREANTVCRVCLQRYVQVFDAAGCASSTKFTAFLYRRLRRTERLPGPKRPLERLQQFVQHFCMKFCQFFKARAVVVAVELTYLLLTDSTEGRNHERNSTSFFHTPTGATRKIRHAGYPRSPCCNDVQHVVYDLCLSPSFFLLKRSLNSEHERRPRHISFKTTVETGMVSTISGCYDVQQVVHDM